MEKLIVTAKLQEILTAAAYLGEQLANRKTPGNKIVSAYLDLEELVGTERARNTVLDTVNVNYSRDEILAGGVK